MQDQSTQVNNSKLYVGNLPYSATEDQLRDLFGQYGEVTGVSLITDKMSGRSKGFGFVEFNSDDQAQAAIDGLNGTELDGRTLVINVARPFAPREDRRGGGGGGFRPRFGGNDRFSGDRRGGRSGGSRDYRN